MQYHQQTLSPVFCTFRSFQADNLHRTSRQSTLQREATPIAPQDAQSSQPPPPDSSLQTQEATEEGEVATRGLPWLQEVAYRLHPPSSNWLSVYVLRQYKGSQHRERDSAFASSAASFCWLHASAAFCLGLATSRKNRLLRSPAMLSILRVLLRPRRI